MAITSFAMAQTQTDFEGVLSEVRVLMEKERWDDAEDRLLAALEVHREGEYLPVHWVEIEEDLARCVFSADYERLSPEELVSGDLRSWNPSSGAIELRYQSGSAGLAVATEADPRAGDFFGFTEEGERDPDTYYFHSMLFKGPYTVELRGERFGQELPMVFVGWDWNTFYGVVCGPRTAIFEVEDGEVRLLDHCTTSIDSDKPYRFSVKLGADSVSASYDGRRLLKVKRPKGDFGRFGFGNFSGLEEVVVTGEIEPSWITGLADSDVQHAWSTFREDFDAFSVLPSWMKDRVAGEAKQAAELLDAAPDALDSRNQLHLNKAKDFCEKGQFDEGLKYAKALGEGEISGETRTWLLTLFSLFTGKTEQALEHCARVCEAAPRFYEGRLLHARLIGYLRSKEDAAIELEKLLSDVPEYVDAYEELAALRFSEGDLDQVRAVIDVALANGVPAQSLEKIGRNLLRARHGPLWSDPSMHESKHYVVVSDMDRSTCYAIAQELEEFYKKYNANLHRISGSDKRKFPVYFFSGHAGYQAYCKDLFGYAPEHTLGVYTSSVKQLLIWNSPDKRTVMRTVRHEGLHQYLDCLTDETPRWLDEGLAEYFEQAKLVRGTWKDDQLNEQHLAALRADVGAWTPLAEFVYSDAAAFMAKADLHYPQAWAFVHFLSNAGREQKKLFDALLDALIEGASRKLALDRVFSDADWRDLEREFRAYVASL